MADQMAGTQVYWMVELMVEMKDLYWADLQVGWKVAQLVDDSVDQMVDSMVVRLV